MQACVPNIGPRQRRRRLASGVISLAIALAAGAYMVTRPGTHVLLRALIFLPFYGALLGFMQFRERT